MNFSVSHNDVDITNLIIEYQTQHQICSGVGALQLTIPLKARTFNPYDTIKIYENGNLSGTFYVSEITDDFQAGQTQILAQDGSKKLADYYFADNTYYTTPTTCKFWIEKLLNEAGVNYQFVVTGSGNLIPPNTPLGPGNAFELITSLLQQSGWYITFDQNNTAIIGKIVVDEEPSITVYDNEILNLSYTRDSEMLRNKAIVWGNVDTRTMETVTAKAEKWTGYEMTSMDWRAVIVASPYIYYKEDAQAIASLLVKEFAKITEVKSIDVAGFISARIADTIGVESRYWSGIGLVTTKRVYVSSKGIVTNLVIDERCPRIFTYFGSKFVYLGTDGAGVWKKPISYPYATWINFSSGIDEDDLVIRDLSVYRGVFCCIGGNNVYRRTSASSWKKLKIPVESAIPVGCKVTESQIYVLATNYAIGKTYIISYSRSGTPIASTELYADGFIGDIIGYDIDSLDERPIVSAKLDTYYFEPNTENNTLKGITAPGSVVGIFDGYLYTVNFAYGRTEIFKVSENFQYKYEFYSAWPPFSFDIATVTGNILTCIQFDLAWDGSAWKYLVTRREFNLATLSYSATTEYIGDVGYNLGSYQPMGYLNDKEHAIRITKVPQFYDQQGGILVSVYDVNLNSVSKTFFDSYEYLDSVYEQNGRFYITITKRSPEFLFNDLPENPNPGTYLVTSYYKVTGNFIVISYYNGNLSYSESPDIIWDFSESKYVSFSPGFGWFSVCGNMCQIAQLIYANLKDSLFDTPVVELSLVTHYDLVYKDYLQNKDCKCEAENINTEIQYYGIDANLTSKRPRTLSDLGIDLNNDGLGGTTHWYFNFLVNGNQLWYMKRIGNYDYLVSMNVLTKQVYAYCVLDRWFYSYQSEPEVISYDERPYLPFSNSGFLLYKGYLGTIPGYAAVPIYSIINYILLQGSKFIDDHHTPFVLELKNSKILEVPTNLSGIYIPTFYKSYSGKFPDDIRYSIASGYPIPNGVIGSGFDELDNYWDLNNYDAAINLTDAKFYSLDLTNVTPAASGLIYIVANGKLVTVDIPEKLIVAEEALPSGFYPYKVEVLASETGIFVAGSGQFYEKTAYTNGMYYPASGGMPNVMPTVLRTDDAV
jgi:hypothetical protein